MTDPTVEAPQYRPHRTNPPGPTLVELVTALGDVYTDQGIAIWLGAANSHLAGNRPIVLLGHGAVEQVAREVERLAGGPVPWGPSDHAPTPVGGGDWDGEAADPTVVEATAGVTRTVDCPEAPTQAHPSPDDQRRAQGTFLVGLVDGRVDELAKWLAAHDAQVRAASEESVRAADGVIRAVLDALGVGYDHDPVLAARRVKAQAEVAQHVSPSVEELRGAIHEATSVLPGESAPYIDHCHVAAEAVLALLASQPTVEQVRREALADAADAYTDFEGAPAGHAMIVRRWLRARAAEAGEPDAE